MQWRRKASYNSYAEHIWEKWIIRICVSIGESLCYVTRSVLPCPLERCNPRACHCVMYSNVLTIPSYGEEAVAQW